MLQHLPSIPVIVAALAAALTSFSRIFAVTRAGWSRCPAWFQTTAPLLLTAAGGIVASLAGVTTWTDLVVVVVAGVFAVLPGAPSNRSAAPMQAGKPATATPSAGDVAVATALANGSIKPVPLKIPSVPTVTTLMLCLLTLMMAIGTGCAWAKGSFWPNVEKCAPAEASLVAQVGQFLQAGGDYESALEQLALTDGKDLVLCAVQAFVNSVGSKVGASPAEMTGVSRGKAFLVEHPVGQ